MGTPAIAPPGLLARFFYLVQGLAPLAMRLRPSGASACITLLFVGRETISNVSV